MKRIPKIGERWKFTSWGFPCPTYICEFLSSEKVWSGNKDNYTFRIITNSIGNISTYDLVGWEYLPNQDRISK
jgi:hypothetical protein